MLYEYIQQIAYEIPTSPAMPAGDLCDVESDLQEVKDPLDGLTEDARKRVKRIIAVAEAAQKSEDVHGEDTTILKLFMAPEFYFRPQQGGTQRSYSGADKEAILAVLKCAFAQEKFKHWLFILGTIVWEEKASAVLGKIQNLTENDALTEAQESGVILWNTAVIAVGGSNVQKVFNKRHYSGADGIDEKYQPDLPNLTASKQLKQGNLIDKLGQENKVALKDYFTAFWKEDRENCLIPMGDLKFGVEVCKDHETGVLRELLQDRKKTLKVNTVPDFQVITACGMRIQPDYVTVAQNAFVFRIDGAGKIDTTWKPEYHASEVQRVIGMRNGNSPIMCAAYIDNQIRYKDTSKDWNELNARRIELPLQGKLLINTNGLQGSKPVYKPKVEEPDVKVDDLETIYPQRVVIYEARRSPYVNAVQVNPQVLNPNINANNK